MNRRRAFAAAAAVLAARPRPVQAEAAPADLRVECGQSLGEALSRARDGDTVELAAGAHHGQVGVIDQPRLTLRAEAAGRAVLHADGQHAEGKALLVVRGESVRVLGIDFRGARVPHGNGAGIRFERGRLHLAHCRFLDNEMGLLSGNDGGAELHIEHCRFGAAPRHEGRLHHLLYVGSIRRLVLEHSRFTGGWRGHLVKCRARESLVRCNQLADSVDGGASYELEFPNGGVAQVVGNLIVQAAGTQNQAMLAYGAELPPHAECRLVVAHNTFVNESDLPAAFVRTWPERLPPDTELQIRHNLMLGAAAEGSTGRAADGNRWQPLAPE